jgi:glycosyltransferase involved in cell wall biosynthesis
MPKVSVIIPNYNHASYLRQRIDSVLGQTFQDMEVIVLDDASSDNSHEVIISYLKDPRVSFHPNKKNSGSPFVQWNRGISMARGEYVWLAESDDYAGKDFLETLVPLLERHPRAGLAYCQSWRVDGKGNPMGTLEDWTRDLDPQRWETGFVSDGYTECKNYLLWKNTMPNASAVLLRKKIYLQAGGAPVDMRLSGDWMIWVRMLLISDVVFTPQCLNFFRNHIASVRETMRAGRLMDEKWKIQRLILQKCKVAGQPRHELARRAFDELIVRIRRCPPNEQRREFFDGLLSFWPFFLLAPAFFAKFVLRRFHKIS